MKLWDKGIATEKAVLDFTIGKDREYDRILAPFDAIASMAHAKMLGETGLVSPEEQDQLLRTLSEIYHTVSEQEFRIGSEFEDIHSCIEFMLTEKLGNTGKKIHTARSRNDQVITDLKLYYREEIIHILDLTVKLVRHLTKRAETHRDTPMPGYTHMQVAMPSSAGLWFSSFAESLTEDLLMLQSAFEYNNYNPLGTAAGYGSAFPVDRELTAHLLEFKSLHVNSINAHFARGKSEWFLLSGISSLASSLSNLSMDLVLYSGQNFDFFRLPDHFTTGSSIMPHKKNPDVAELIRARCNLLISGPARIQQLTTNLPSGYHRDLQLLKEVTFPSIASIKDCLSMTDKMMEKLEVNKEILDNPAYTYIGSVNRMNEKVMQGTSYRDAYRETAQEIASGEYKIDTDLKTSHTGSINNLSIALIENKLDEIADRFEAEKYRGFRERFIQNLKKT